MLASLIVEGVDRRTRRPVDVASPWTPVLTAPMEISRSPASSLLPQQDKYVIGLSSPFAKYEPEKPLSKKRPTRKIKVWDVSK